MKSRFNPLKKFVQTSLHDQAMLEYVAEVQRQSKPGSNPAQPIDLDSDSDSDSASNLEVNLPPQQRKIRVGISRSQLLARKKPQ